MNKLQKRIFTSILGNLCPVRIPRTGESGRQIDCYSVSFYEGKSPILLVNSIDAHGIHGSHFEGGGFQTEASIPFYLVAGLNLRIDHYHGLVVHTYTGMLDFVIHEWTQFYRLQSIYTLAKDSVPPCVRIVVASNFLVRGRKNESKI